MPPFAVKIVALVSFASSWSIGHGLSSLLTPAKKTVNSAFDDLLPVFEKDDDGSDFYDAIHQNYVIETPTEEDMRNIIETIIDGKESSYFTDNHLIFYGNQRGMARLSNGFTTDVSSYIYGKFTGNKKRGQYISVALNFDKFGFGAVNGPVGTLFYSTMGFSVEGNNVNWQGITKGSGFIIGTNKNTLVMNSFAGVTKGSTEYLDKDKIQTSINTLGAYDSGKGSNSHNTTYLGIIETGDSPFQSIVLGISYLPIGSYGTFFLNSTFQEDGSVGYLGEGSIYRNEGNFTTTMNITGNSQFNFDNPYSEDSLQHFFNAIYFGKGIFLP